MTKITKKQETNRLWVIIRGIILSFIIMMSLLHVYFNRESVELVTHKEEVYNVLIRERNQVESELIQSLLNDSLTKQEYALAVVEHKKLYRKKLKACNQEKKSIAHAFSFNGRKSFHFWLFIFGLSFSFFFLAVRYTYRIIDDYKNIHLKKSLVLEASTWMAVSLFWVIHSIFVKNSDLPTPVYTIVMFSICLVIGFSIFFLIKYLINRQEHTLKSYKTSIVNLIQLVGEIRVDHYFKMAAKAMDKENEEIISKDSEVMDKKIFSTLEKVADGEQ